MAKSCKRPLLATDAQALIARLADPDDPRAVPRTLTGEDRLRVLLYILRQVGFDASGVKASVRFQAQGGGGWTHDMPLDLHAIAIREGAPSQMFSLHLKPLVSLDAYLALDGQVEVQVNRMARLRGNVQASRVVWQETYPELQKQRDLLKEIDREDGSLRPLLARLGMEADSWKLGHETVAVSDPASKPSRPRL